MADGGSNLYIGTLFLLWYAFNVAYNWFNKIVLKQLNLPLTVASLQLGLGLIMYQVPLWITGVRKVPAISQAKAMKIMPLALCNGFGQIVTVLSLGAGSLAFVNVVKSLEPLFNVIFGALIMGDVLPWTVNACLLPVIGGVGIASAADLSFTWDCFAYAMGSNFFFSLRGVLSKKALAGEKKDVGNDFAVLTAFSFLGVMPIALAVEGPVLHKEWEAALAKGAFTQNELILYIVGSGLTFYLYNEVSFFSLDLVHPITHAVVNTIKRVILILFSVVAFGTAMTTQSAIGSTIAISGVFAYSIAKQMTGKKPAEKAKKAL